MISIIIVSYNHPDLLRQTLLSLAKTGPNNAEIIVVDNSENRDVELMMAEEFKEIILLKMEKNIGFGRANNIGFNKSKGEYIAFLNNDLLLEEDVLTPLINQLTKDESLGIIGPKLLNQDKTLQYSCCNFPSVSDNIRAEFRGDQMVSNWYLTDWDHEVSREVGYVSGALMVMRREVFEKIGMFDEIYFMYSEEVDLCYRVQQTGLRVIYFPAASAIHLGGASSERNSRRINELLYLSRLKFRRKHFGLWATFIQIFGVGSIALLKLIPIGLRILIIPRNRAERQNRFVRNINIFFLMVHLSAILITRNKNSFLNYSITS